MKRELRIFLVALLFGLLAVGALWYLQRLSIERVPAVTAARDLPARHVIAREDLAVIMVPPGQRDAKALQDPAQLVGQELLSPVYAGEQLRPERVIPAERALAADEVAVPLKTDLVRSLGGTLKAGDLVDIYWTPRALAGGRSGRVEVQRIGEGFRVFAIRDAGARATGDDVNNADPTRTQAVGGVPAVVLLKVPLEMVPGLLQATELGELTLTRWSDLRPRPDRPVLTALNDAFVTVDVNGALRAPGSASPVTKPSAPPVSGGLGNGATVPAATTPAPGARPREGED